MTPIFLPVFDFDDESRYGHVCIPAFESLFSHYAQQLELSKPRKSDRNRRNRTVSTTNTAPIVLPGGAHFFPGPAALEPEERELLEIVSREQETVRDVISEGILAGLLYWQEIQLQMKQIRKPWCREDGVLRSGLHHNQCLQIIEMYFEKAEYVRCIVHLPGVLLFPGSKSPYFELQIAQKPTWKAYVTEER